MQDEQQDFFAPGPVAGLSSYRDDIDIMSLPFLAVEKRRTTPMESGDPNNPKDPYIKVTGADYGLATKWDGKFLIAIRTMMVQAMNNGEEPSRKIRTTGYDLLRAIKCTTSKRDYIRLEESLQRLKATTIATNVGDGRNRVKAAISFLDRYVYLEKETAKGPVNNGIEIEVSEWLYNLCIDPKRSISIDPIYFEITGGVEMALYGIFRRHLGNQPVWCIGVDRLQQKVGSIAARRKFVAKLREVAAENSVPGFQIELSDKVPEDMWRRAGTYSSRQVRPPDLPADTPGKENIVIVRPALQSL